MHVRRKAAFTALLAAARFGATTPLAKMLVGGVSAFMVAGLSYIGSGIGLSVVVLVERLRHIAGER